MPYTYSQQVADQQRALNSQGANLKVDGLLGPLTQAAIDKYTPKTSSPTSNPYADSALAPGQFGATTPTGQSSIAKPKTPPPAITPPSGKTTGSFNGNIYNVDSKGIPYGNPISLSSQSSPTNDTTVTPPPQNTTTNTTVSPEDQKLLSAGVTQAEIDKMKTPEGLDPMSFQSVIQKVEEKFKTNNDLMTTRQILLKGLFDSKLTPDELAKLPTNIQDLYKSGNTNAIQLQVRILNDEISGRANNITKSIDTLVSGYQTSIQQAEQQKQNAEANIMQYLQMYGSDAVPFLKTKYPEAATTIDQLANLATLAEKKNSQTGTGSTSNNVMTDNERALFNQFNGEPIVKDYNTILAKKLTVDQILSSKLGGPGDLAVVYEFMKGLDPTSVVRESEYQTAAQSGNIFAGVMARFNGYLKPEGGFLPDAVKKDFQSIVNSKLAVQTQLYNNVKKQYESIAGRQGLNPNNVTIDYSAANTNSANTPGIKKGSMTSAQFVEKVLSSQGLKYEDVLAQIPPGKVGVIDNETGEIGILDSESEFNANKYTHL